MSIHPSLRSAGGKTRTSRNVLKRHERVRHLMNQGSWSDERSIFGLPKIKQLKVKARQAAAKEKAAETAEKPAEQTEAEPPR